MNKRQLKKRNRKFIDLIIRYIPYTLKKRCFGSGYFIFSFDESSVSWFYLKEFPEWKFAIWLNEEHGKYEIFGQHINMIDKFKPSRSELCEDNVQSFVDELHKIYTREDAWLEYLDEAAEEKARMDVVSLQNKIYYEALFNFIKGWNDKQDTKAEWDFKCIYLKLKDGGAGRSPRYDIIVESYKEFQAEEFNHEWFEMEWDAYQQLCVHLGKMYTPEKITSYDTDSYIFRSTISEEILCQQEWEHRAVEYKWKQQNYGIHLQEMYDYNRRNYEISDIELKYILHSWFETNYCDNHSIDGFINTIERVYSGQYNIGYAKSIINEMFRKPERVSIWLNKYKESLNKGK